jgi:hypothetical protein
MKRTHAAVLIVIVAALLFAPVDFSMWTWTRLALVGTVILLFFVIPTAIAYLDQRGGPRHYR